MNNTILPPKRPIVILYEDGDELIHTDEYPLCDDMECPCWEALSEEAERDEREYFNLSYLEPVYHPEERRHYYNE